MAYWCSLVHCAFFPMLRFSLPTTDAVSTSTLRDVVLFDKDEIVVPGKVRVKDGVLNCKWKEDGAKAISLRWNAGRAGDMSLRTCLLPQREQPYQLSVELARHRIGTFVFKAEEWQMSGRLSPEHPAMMCWEKARELFTKAMVTNDHQEAEAAAKKSLTLAIEATERLAMAYAELQLKIRFGNKRLPSTAVGVRVPLRPVGDAIRRTILNEFPLVTVPLSWSALCDDAGQYDWAQSDEWIGWATDNRCRIASGPLVDLSVGNVPRWVRARLDAGDSLNDIAWDHVHKVVSRYGDHVGMWCVGNGINTNDELDLDPEAMVDLVRSLALCIRESNRGRRILLEIDQPWGDHVYNGPGGLDPLQFVEHVMQRGVRLDSVGLRIRMGDSVPGRSVRDLMEVSRLVDRYFLLDIPIIISRLGAPDASNLKGGRWRESMWDADVQARWAARAIVMLISKRHVQSVIWNDLVDSPDTKPPGGGMIGSDGTPKPILTRVVTLLRRLRTPTAAS